MNRSEYKGDRAGGCKTSSSITFSSFAFAIFYFQFHSHSLLMMSRSSKTSLASRKSRRPSRQMSASSRSEQLSDPIKSFLGSPPIKKYNFQANLHFRHSITNLSQAIVHLWPPCRWTVKQTKEAKTLWGSFCWLGPGPGMEKFKHTMQKRTFIFCWCFHSVITIFQGTVEEDELDEGSKQEVEQSAQEANMAGMQNIQVELFSWGQHVNFFVSWK